ncbi:hypothetical protein U9M48_019276 [Paspalum notatum var. saurae]|uniref:RNase H type-1 domain-containing protein n=1 Tax=Paspalum notatum var. saurae TaxID=547442 RepID=A0AAQ3TBV8_PASNO
MHSGWSITVAPGFSSPLESPRCPSEGLHHHCRTALPCTELPWPTDAEHCLRSIGGLLSQSIEVFIIYLQSIGGLELVDNHSSHQESNEAGPLALKAEYIAATSCCSQLLWLKATLSDFGLRFRKITLQVDSTSAIFVAKNPVLHSRTKHIDMRL